MFGRPVFVFLVMGLYFVCGVIVFLVFEIQTPESCPHSFAYEENCKSPNTFHKKLRHSARNYYKIIEKIYTSSGVGRKIDLFGGILQFADISPLYEVFSLNASSSSRIDNICYTFFHLDQTSYIIFKSIVYHNGTEEVSLLVESEIPGRPGVFRAASKAVFANYLARNHISLDNQMGVPVQLLTLLDLLEQCDLAHFMVKCVENNFDICSFDEYLIGRYNCSDTGYAIYYFYTCFLHGECKRTNAPQDMRHGLSATPPQHLGKTCYKLALTDLKLKTLEHRGRVFTVYPNKLRRRCVTSYNGAMAINAHKIDQEDEIAYP